MKKFAVIALVVVCAASLMGNVFLYQRANSLDGQLAEQTAKAADLSAQIEENNRNMADLQAEFEALQALHETWNDSPEQNQAEQSTQGATDKTQTRAPQSVEEVIEQEVSSQAQQQQQQPPKNQEKWENSSSSQVQNPSQSDVNDLLNDTFGSTGGTSKPSSGSAYDDITQADPNAGLLGDHGFSNDDFDWG